VRAAAAVMATMPTRLPISTREISGQVIRAMRFLGRAGGNFLLRPVSYAGQSRLAAAGADFRSRVDAGYPIYVDAFDASQEVIRQCASNGQRRILMC